MKYILDSLALDIDADIRAMKAAIGRRLGISERSFRYEVLDREFRVEGIRRLVVYKVEIETVEFIRDTSIHFVPDLESFSIPRYSHKDRPVVVGAGLAGLFAAYVLALSGARPIVLEQGKNYPQRRQEYDYFVSHSKVDGLPSLRYGLGGYLGMSGCRLSRDTGDLMERWAVSTLEGLGFALPKDHHIFLPAAKVGEIASALAKEIARHGGEIKCECQYKGTKSMLGKIKEVRYEEKGIEKGIATSHVLLACGEGNIPSSSRSGIKIKDHPVRAVSFLLEKPSSELFRPLYGTSYPDPKLPLAFSLITGSPSLEFSTAFSHFYPSTVPILMASEAKQIDLGLSIANKGEANGISLLSLLPSSGALTKEEALELTKLSFKESLPYACPAETTKDFLLGKDPLRLSTFKPSYRKGVYLANLSNIFSGKVGVALKESLARLVRKESVFADGRALLLGPSITLSDGSKEIDLGQGKTSVRGLYIAGNCHNYEYSGLETLQSGIRAALSLLGS